MTQKKKPNKIIEVDERLIQEWRQYGSICHVQYPKGLVGLVQLENKIFKVVRQKECYNVRTDDNYRYLLEFVRKDK